MITGLKVTLTHDDWTLYTEKFKDDIVLSINTANINFEDGLVYSLVNVEAPNKEIIEKLMEVVKKHRRVKNLRLVDLKNNRTYTLALLSMVTTLNDGIRGVLSQFEIYYAKEYISDGNETWFLVVNKRYSDLISRLKEMSYTFDYSQHSLDEIFPLNNVLTKKEKEILVTAYQLGYFEWPHTLNIGELAEKFNISKTAILQTLRRAIRKLVANYVNSYS